MSQQQSYELKKEAIGLPGLIAQSLGVTGPEMSAVIIASVAAMMVGASTPLVFIVAGIGALALAWVYSRLARYAPHAGGSYALIRAGLGSQVGFFAGWVNLAVGLVFVPALVIAGSFLMLNFWSTVAPNVAWLGQQWIWWAVIFGAVIFILSYRGVEISSKVLLGLTVIGVGLLLILDLGILIKGGAKGLAWSSFTASGIGFGTFALAVGVAMTGYSGFETAVFLAEEAHAPTRMVPKAVMGAGIVALIFYVLTTFAIVSGYGVEKAASDWPKDSAGSVVVLASQFITEWFGALLLLVLVISSLASALGTLNFTSRIAFSWGREGQLPKVFSRTHNQFKTPHVALLWTGVVTAVVYALGLFWQGNTMDGAMTFFSWLLLCGATGILPVYALIGISGFRHASMTGGSVLDRIVAPLLAVLVVVAAEISQFYPVQDPPFTYAPYVMVGWMVLGIILGLVNRQGASAASKVSA